MMTAQIYDEKYYRILKYYPKNHFIEYMKHLNHKNQKWLDIGCATGNLLTEIENHDINPYGMDISKYAISNIPKKYRCCVADIVNMPFKDETYSIVTAFDIIEHVHPKYTETMFFELKRVLAKGGSLILTTPNPCYIGDWIKDVSHINVRPPQFWKNMLIKNGFNVKMNYIPAFLKYHPSAYFLRIIPDYIEYFAEEPLRHLFGYISMRMGRVYIYAKRKINS